MKKKICLVVADYYPKISHNLINGASKILKLRGIKNYKIFKVPGVFELPFTIVKNISNYDGFIALGCVIKGIITCLNKKQALDRSSVKNNKGQESAKAMLSLLEI